MAAEGRVDTQDMRETTEDIGRRIELAELFLLEEGSDLRRAARAIHLGLGFPGARRGVLGLLPAGWQRRGRLVCHIVKGIRYLVANVLVVRRPFVVWRCSKEHIGNID